MTENQEISEAYFFTTGSRTPIYLTSVDGKPYVAFSTEIAVPLAEFQSMLERTNVKPVTLKAMCSP